MTERRALMLATLCFVIGAAVAFVGWFLISYRAVIIEILSVQQP